MNTALNGALVASVFLSGCAAESETEALGHMRFIGASDREDALEKINEICDSAEVLTEEDVELQEIRGHGHAIDTGEPIYFDTSYGFRCPAAGKDLT